MKMKNKIKKVYAIADKAREDLNEFFIQFYDYNSWFYKLKLLDLCLKKPNKFISQIGDKELKKSDKKKFIRTLKSEIFFTQFHLSEALFGLMYSFIRDETNPWIILTVYKSEELNNFVQKIKDKKLQLTDDLIFYLFYFGIIDKEKEREDIKKSIKFIRDFIIALSNEFTNHDAYNSYKHGFRVMNLKSSFSLSKEQKAFFSITGDAHTFLKKEFIFHNPKIRTSFFKISEVSESFDYRRSLRISINILRLITNIVKSRQNFMKYKKARKTEPEKMKIGIYKKSDVKEIFKIDPNTYFRFKISFPTMNPK